MNRKEKFSSDKPRFPFGEGYDPLGSYTGVYEEDPNELPVQDADDL